MADRYGQVLPLRMFVPNAKEYRYWSGVPSFDPQPVTAVNSVETVQVAFSIHSRILIQIGRLIVLLICGT
jgi:hypothetical protein